jgi:tetratricopeptide (TPR) repeat protein
MTPPKAAETKQQASKPVTALFGLGKIELDAIEVLGFELWQQGRNREAEAIFDGLIVLNKQMYQGYAGKGALALADERLEEAASWLTQAAERNTGDPTVHANLGETLLRLGRFEEAAAELEKALSLDPEAVDPAANRARAILAGMKIVMRELESRPPDEQLSDPGLR